MVKGPEANSEILESTSFIKVQNPRGAEWFQEDPLEYLLWPYHPGDPRILLPASHRGSAQPQPAEARVYPGVPLFIYPKHPINKPGQHSESQVGPAVPATASHCRIHRCSKGYSKQMLAVFTRQARASRMQGL